MPRLWLDNFVEEVLYTRGFGSYNDHCVVRVDNSSAACGQQDTNPRGMPGSRAVTRRPGMLCCFQRRVVVEHAPSVITALSFGLCQPSRTKTSRGYVVCAMRSVPVVRRRVSSAADCKCLRPPDHGLSSWDTLYPISINSAIADSGSFRTAARSCFVSQRSRCRRMTSCHPS